MWCGHAASALNPVIEAVTDNKCLDILAQSAGQCKCFLILFFAAQCRFTIDVLQKVKKEVTNSESCVTVKLLHQKSNKEAIRQ